MNLITRSKPEKSINVRVEGGYGTDLDEGADGRHGERYRAGGDIPLFLGKTKHGRTRRNQQQQPGVGLQ